MREIGIKISLYTDYFFPNSLRCRLIFEYYRFVFARNQAYSEAYGPRILKIVVEICKQKKKNKIKKNRQKFKKNLKSSNPEFSD